MSFLTEVLSIAGETDLQTLKHKLPIISSQLFAAKQEVIKYIEDVYYKFSEYPSSNQKLLNVSSQLSTDLNDLQKKIEQVTVKEIEKSNIEIDHLSEELDRSKDKLTFITIVIDIHEGLVNIRNLSRDEQYVKAAHAFVNLDTKLQLLQNEESPESVVILKNKVLLEQVAIQNKLYDMFNEVIQVNRKTLNNVQTYTFKIARLHESVPELLEALQLLNQFERTLDCVYLFILEACKGIIHNVTTIKHHDEDNYYVLIVAVKKTIVKSQVKEVFAKLLEMFSFFNSRFDYAIDDRLTSMQYFGITFGHNFTNIVITDCLDRTKPENDSDFDKFDVIIDEVDKFHRKLVEYNVLEDDNEISEYTKSMDGVLIEHKCNQYLAAAITLMKGDLHNSLEVGVECGDGSSLMPAQFPRSVISQSVIDILRLVESLLDEASEKSSDVYAARLICTAQSIFYQYGSIVHGHHERLLATIPQQVALFRNNCLYIAHSLLRLNADYSDKFSTTALPTPPLFTNQVLQLQTMGGEIFLGYIDDQVRLMEAMLNEYLTPAQVADKLNPDLEKLIRQCLRQYELLRTVWIKILPSSVYNKNIGHLFNAYCKKLIMTVLSAPDISKQNVEQLVDSFKVVITRGPKLFSDPKEVSSHVESWGKLNDLIFMLSASLIQISEMWSEGKGILTLTFTAKEVKSLIKAMFQDTELRATVLSAIC